MKAQLAVLFGLVALLVDVSAFVAQSCGSNEILASSPPSCESTCYQACASSPTGVYEPTCVCMPTFVRNNGQCVPKASCPSVVVAMHPMLSAMAGSSGDVAYIGSSGTAPQQPAQGGALPGLLSSMFGSGSDSSVEGPVMTQLGGSSPSGHGSMIKQLASEVAAILQSGAASSTSASDKSFSNEIPSSGGPALQNPPVSSASTGSQNVPYPPLNPAALKADCKYSGKEN
ncbi:uncharacterized protein LOC120424479 [Culex pipiens pallens]|uniref:uncharacterized protein LOC120424479 n=1 Tax=Culex pipiens pallens TaxID=42434 RepID=UPI001952C2F0|nr:uncharacterized protein LOC120424479 [Culex pipiens pallens]